MPSYAIRQRRNAFTLMQLAICIAILFVLSFLLVLLFQQHRHYHFETGASHQKQIALSFLQYIEDYDEHFPPVSCPTYPIDPVTGKQDTIAGLCEQSWGPSLLQKDGHVIPGLLSPYAHSNLLFIDDSIPNIPTRDLVLCFMYNDLLAMQSQSDLSRASLTVLTTGAENRIANAGHAYTPDSGPFAALFDGKGHCVPGLGASVRQERFRRNGGANFTFTDGHMKWFKGGDDDPIFFPPRSQSSVTAIDSKTKQQIGPIPGEKMEFQERSYKGTFQLR